MIGETVKYYSGTNTGDGMMKREICYATCIGYDDYYIYTRFRHVPDHFTRHEKWNDRFDMSMVNREFRIGFHRSRLIGLVKPLETIPSGTGTQLSLFS